MTPAPARPPGVEDRAVEKGSHHILIHPAVRELLNLQNVRGQAKPYEVKQLAQLVELITRSKTTTEVGQTLYGVTRQEPGVARLVSVQFRLSSRAVVQRKA